jgi:HSP20 family protein
MFFAPATTSEFRNRAVDRGFERFLNESFFRSGLKVVQDDSSWTVTLDLPGVAREQLDINVEGAILSIATTAQAPRQYRLAYELPEEIDVEATTATLEHGVLTLKLGKKKPVSNARKIAVN